MGRARKLWMNSSCFHLFLIFNPRRYNFLRYPKHRFQECVHPDVHKGRVLAPTRYVKLDDIFWFLLGLPDCVSSTRPLSSDFETSLSSWTATAIGTPFEWARCHRLGFRPPSSASSARIEMYSRFDQGRPHSHIGRG